MGTLKVKMMGAQCGLRNVLTYEKLDCKAPKVGLNLAYWIARPQKLDLTLRNLAGTCVGGGNGPHC